MADNLLELATRQLGSAGIGALSDALGLPAEKGESAVNTGLSSVLAGMLHKGSSKTGMGNLFNMVTGSGDLDFDAIADVFKDPEKMSGLQKSGGNMLEGIFGGRADRIGELVSVALGAGDKGGSLLKVAAPIVVSLLGRLVKGRGLDVSSLASLLLAQKPFIQDKIPDGLLKALEVPSFDKLGAALVTHGHAQPQEPRPQALHAEEKKRSGFGKWFWPLLIALAALYALNMCAKKEKMEDRPGEVILDEESVLIEETPNAAAKPPGDEAPAGTEAGTQTADFADSLREYLGSAARDPNREFPLAVAFAEDSAEVTSTSVPDVEALAKIMQENPGLTIAIEGHTSGDGDEIKNQELSQERADTVRQMLVEKGIDPNRVTATGMGSAKPVADDSTEEGKQKNRRISVRVVTFE